MSQEAMDGPEEPPVPDDLTALPGLEGDPPGRRRLRWALGLVLAVLAAVGIGWISQIPYTVHDEDSGMLRLSWRAAGEALEECRPMTGEEAPAQPAPAVQDEVCEERVPPHRLTLVVDGRTRISQVLEPGGIRGDRPFFVHEDMLLPPEEARRVEVSFGPDPEAVREIREEAEAEGVELEPSDAGELRQRSLDRQVEVEARGIALVTLDSDGELVVRRPDPADPGEAAAANDASIPGSTP